MLPVNQPGSLHIPFSCPVAQKYHVAYGRRETLWPQGP